MCCGNNSKFKQLSLGKSGDCLEISQEQVCFWFLFIPSFHWYLDSNIFSSYFRFSCCDVNIPKAKNTDKTRDGNFSFQTLQAFFFGLEWAKAITCLTLCMNSQCFIWSEVKTRYNCARTGFSVEDLPWSWLMILLQSRVGLQICVQGNLSSTFTATASITRPLWQLISTEVPRNLRGSYHAHNIDLL